MLDHETIRSFIKVAECQSFSRAAELLHKTTATISYRIKTLEEHRHAAVYPHHPHRQPDAGRKYLLERCRQWHTWLDAMPGELRQINDGVEHQVNIVINNLLYDARRRRSRAVDPPARQIPVHPIPHFPPGVHGCGMRC